MNENNLTITELQDSVNHIFECESKINRLQSHVASLTAEMVLVEHLLKAFQILDSHDPFDVN